MFGIGRKREVQENEISQQTPSSKIEPSAPRIHPETISTMLNGFTPPATASNDDAIEYLFIDDNPFGLKTPKPTGSFGPFPMRNGMSDCGVCWMMLMNLHNEDCITYAQCYRLI